MKNQRDVEKEKSATAIATTEKPSPTTSEPMSAKPLQQQAGLVQIINVISERIDTVVKLISTITEKHIQVKETEARFSVRMAWLAVAIVALIVIVSGLLTYLGKIDGSTLTFLLGLIVGYVLTFVRDSIALPDK